MELYFWQNIISPHQLPYISQLLREEKVDKVVLIVSESLDIERTTMGWDTSANYDIEIIIKPTIDAIHSLYSMSSKESYHFFSGIRAFPFIFKAFKIGLGYSIKRGLIVEPPFTYKKPLFLHIIRMFVFDYRYYKKIDFVYAFGTESYNWYKRWRKNWKVYEFSYCVEQPVFQNISPVGKIKFLYIGSLIPRKNVKLILNSLKNIDKQKYNLSIVGNGTEVNNLKKIASQESMSGNINFLGSMARKSIQKIITNYDILILPSNYDGWGAVVNEALMSGLFVLCSDKCGSKALINDSNGIVFKLNSKEKGLENKINLCVNKIDVIRSEKKERYEWSKSITGVSIADYFVKCLVSNKLIIPPWKIK